MCTQNRIPSSLAFRVQVYSTETLQLVSARAYKERAFPLKRPRSFFVKNNLSVCEIIAVYFLDVTFEQNIFDRQM